MSKKSGAVIFLLIAAVCTFFLLGGQVVKTRATEETEETKRELVDNIIREDLPVLTLPDGSEASLYDSKAVDDTGRYYTEAILEMHGDDVDAILEMNKDDNEVIMSVVSDMSWSPTIAVIGVAGVGFLCVIAYFLLKKDGA